MIWGIDHVQCCEPSEPVAPNNYYFYWYAAPLCRADCLIYHFEWIWGVMSDECEWWAWATSTLSVPIVVEEGEQEEGHDVFGWDGSFPWSHDVIQLQIASNSPWGSISAHSLPTVKPWFSTLLHSLVSPGIPLTLAVYVKIYCPLIIIQMGSSLLAYSLHKQGIYQHRQHFPSNQCIT